MSHSCKTCNLAALPGLWSSAPSCRVPSERPALLSRIWSRLVCSVRVKTFEKTAERLRVGSVGDLQLDLVWQLVGVPAMASWAPVSQQATWHLHVLVAEEEPAFAFLQVGPIAAALLPQLERAWSQAVGAHAMGANTGSERGTML